MGVRNNRSRCSSIFKYMKPFVPIYGGGKAQSFRFQIRCSYPVQPSPLPNHPLIPGANMTRITKSPIACIISMLALYTPSALAEVTIKNCKASNGVFFFAWYVPLSTAHKLVCQNAREHLTNVTQVSGRIWHLRRLPEQRSPKDTARPSRDGLRGADAVQVHRTEQWGFDVHFQRRCVLREWRT